MHCPFRKVNYFVCGNECRVQSVRRPGLFCLLHTLWIITTSELMPETSLRKWKEMKWSWWWMEGGVWLHVVWYKCFGCTYCLLERDCVWFGSYVPMFRMYVLSLGTWLPTIWWISTKVSDVHTVSWTWLRVICWISTYVWDVHTVSWEVTASDLVDKYQGFGCTYCLLDVTACDLVDKYQCLGCTYCLLGRDC